MSRPADTAIAITLSLALPIIAGVVGGLFTSASLDGWYQGIAKPDWTPPGSVIGSVWTFLFLTMGISLFLVIKSGLESPDVRVALGVYVLQIILNIGWSWAFFYMRSPALGLIEIGLLFLSIALTIALFWGLSRGAALLLLPYLGWVGFAAYLNYSIWKLN